MSSVRVEIKAFTDPRFAVFGRLCGCPARWAARWGRATAEELWAHCTELQAYELAPAVVDVVAGVDGAVAHLVTAGLGEVRGEKVYIRGTDGRIEWLAERREASKAGGAATRAKWEAKRQAKRGPDGLDLARPNGGPNGGVPAPAPAPALSGSCSSDASGDPLTKGRTRSSGSGDGARAVHPDHPRLIAWFDATFRDRTGAAPTWDKATGAIVRDLLKLHGYDETVRRAEVMFAWPRGSFPVDSTPTLYMLRRHIDTFVGLPSAKPGRDRGLTAAEIYQSALDLERGQS